MPVFRRDRAVLPTAIDINFDSLNEACGFPPGFRDPSFFAAFDRLQSLADRFGFKMSLFIIGRDLENPEIAARVREWGQAGHEIGNHTWTHRFDFGALPPVQIQDEIQRAHDRIGTVTGVAPRGFIAPNWCTSHHVANTLIRLGYLYDSSAFPSVMMAALVAKAALNHRKDPERVMRLLRRRDWLLQPRLGGEPFLVDGRYRRVKTAGPGTMVMLPLPTRSPLHLPLWHTVGLMFDQNRYLRQVRQAVTRPGFYHLMHPADFTGPEDLNDTQTHSLERFSIPVAQKMDLVERVFTILAESGRPVVTMAELASAVRAGFSS